MPRKGHLAVVEAVFALLILGSSLGACASMEPTVAMTEADKQLMDQAVQQSLEIDKVGQSRNWGKPEAGHVGTVTPLRTFANDSGRPCRDYQQTVTVGGSTRLAYDTACRQPNGDWRSVNFGGLAGFDSFHPSYPSMERAYGHRHHGFPYYHPGYYPNHFIYGSRYYHRGHDFWFGYDRY